MLDAVQAWKTAEVSLTCKNKTRLGTAIQDQNFLQNSSRSSAFVQSFISIVIYMARLCCKNAKLITALCFQLHSHFCQRSERTEGLRRLTAEAEFFALTLCPVTSCGGKKEGEIKYSSWEYLTWIACRPCWASARSWMVRVLESCRASWR